MNDYLVQLRDYIIENTNDTKVTVKLKIYSEGNGDFQVTKFIQNELGEDQYMRTPFGILQEIVQHLLSESTDWNIFEYELSMDQQAVWSTSWDVEREAIEKAPVFDENADAEFVPDTLGEGSDVVMDYASPESLKPWYFVKSTNTSIGEIVQTMLEQGAELDTDDLDDLDFNKEFWNNVFENLQNKVDQSEVKIRIEAEFDPITKGITQVLFSISNDGNIEVLRSSDF